MIVIQMLLPRFLVLEVVLFFHFLQLGQCSRKASTYSKSQERLDRQITLNTSGSAVKNITSFRSHSVNYDTISKINVASTDPSVTCKIDLNKESLQWMPMFFSSKNNSYLMPTNNQIAHFKGTSKQKRIKTKKKPYRSNDEMIDGPSRWLAVEEKDDVFAICPGTRFRVINSDKKHIQCVGGKLVEINNERKSNDVKKSLPSLEKTALFDLSCAKSIKESILTTEQRCGPPAGNGRLSHIGWSWEREESDSSFTSQVTVCHDQETENTYYTNHTIFGPSIDAKKRGKFRQIPFKEGGKQFYASSSAANAYKISSQRNLFSKLLPKEKERSKIFFPGGKRNLYLSKGHLSPDADFVWKEWQDATYYFFNAAPQWQSFNNGNWKAVEEAVRRYASNNRINLRVLTGTEGQLRIGQSRLPVSMSTKMDNLKKVTNDLIPAPLHFWKLIYDEEYNAGIVFIGLNDPHISSDAINQFSAGTGTLLRSLCPKDDTRLCEQAGWKFSHRKSIHKGFLYCCSVNSFNEILPWATKAAEIPHNVQVLNFSPDLAPEV